MIYFLIIVVVASLGKLILCILDVRANQRNKEIEHAISQAGLINKPTNRPP